MYQPLIMLQVNPETGATHKIFEKKWDRDYQYFRGGTTPIPFKLEKDGFLFFIHEVVDVSHRYYLTRGVWLSADFTDIRITSSFYFLERGIEFAVGLSYALHDPEVIIIGVGINDRKAFLFEITLMTIRDMFM